MTKPPTPVLARFWKKVAKTDTCWLWTDVPSRAGYGQIWSADIQGQVYAHRFSYELHKGPIPDGLVIDHLCRVRHCVNPDHLEVVTRAENNRRGLVRERRMAQAAAITHCKHGHEWTPETTRTSKSGRHCRTCDRNRYIGVAPPKA